MFANKNSQRRRMVSIILFFATLVLSILKSNLSYAGSVQADAGLNRLVNVNVSSVKAIARASTALPECPAPEKLSEVRGEINNCAQGKNSSATVVVGNKIIEHGKK